MAFNYQLKRSRRRRSVGITVDPRRGVAVAAPFWVSQAQINEVLKDKQAWIEEKLALFAAQPAWQEKTFQEGELLLFLGREYQLRHDHALAKGVYLQAEQVVVSPGPRKDPRSIKKLIRAWYYSAAGKILAERIAFYSSKLAVYPGKVAVKEHRRQWGSCSRKGNLNFNWKLVMAPLEIVDYVVVHELSHLHYLNHSKLFWAKVASIVPNYKERRKWLKTHGLKLEL
ncbi:MAG: SprT family zinc-dependent metalloprotease [Candidatus Margulisiibacteriota bacterium]|jgi:hypothetical protein